MPPLAGSTRRIVVAPTTTILGLPAWPHRLADVIADEPQPLSVDTARLLRIGMALWAAALVVSLLVPTLHQGDKHWWPWACVTGIALGGLTLLYVRRGRGNAAMAQPNP